eukprot:scaffold1305_cov248-Pinguiococcus_pyrenoidosus.AAC.8
MRKFFAEAPCTLPPANLSTKDPAASFHSGTRLHNRMASPKPVLLRKPCSWAPELAGKVLGALPLRHGPFCRGRHGSGVLLGGQVAPALDGSRRRDVHLDEPHFRTGLRHHFQGVVDLGQDLAVRLAGPAAKLLQHAVAVLAPPHAQPEAVVLALQHGAPAVGSDLLVRVVQPRGVVLVLAEVEVSVLGAQRAEQELVGVLQMQLEAVLVLPQQVAADPVVAPRAPVSIGMAAEVERAAPATDLGCWQGWMYASARYSLACPASSRS